MCAVACSDSVRPTGTSSEADVRLKPGITFAVDIEPSIAAFDMDDMADVAMQSQAMLAGKWRVYSAAAERCSAAAMARCTESECHVVLLLREQERLPVTRQLKLLGRPTDLYLDSTCSAHLVGTRSTEIRHVTRTPSDATFRASVGPEASVTVKWRTTDQPSRTLQALVASSDDAEIGLAVELEGEDQGASWIVGFGTAADIRIRRRPLPDLEGYVHASIYGGAIAERGGLVVAIDGSSLGPPWEALPGVAFATVSKGNDLLAGRRLSELHVPGIKGPVRLRSLTGLAISAGDTFFVAGHAYSDADALAATEPFVAAYDTKLKLLWTWRGTVGNGDAAATVSLPVIADASSGRVVRLGGDAAMGVSSALAAFGLVDGNGPAMPPAGSLDIGGVTLASAASTSQGRATFAVRSARGLALVVVDGWGRIDVPNPDPCNGDGALSCSDGDPTTIDRCTPAGCVHFDVDGVPTP